MIQFMQVMNNLQNEPSDIRKEYEIDKKNYKVFREESSGFMMEIIILVFCRHFCIILQCVVGVLFDTIW